MSKNNENKLVPRLRFPEFRNESWKDSELSKLGKTINGLNGKSSEDFGTGKPFVTYKQVFDSAKVDLSKCGRVVIKENENQNTLLKGDILFTTSSETPHEVGYASVVLNEPNEPTYLNSFCFSFRPFSLKQLQPEFSQYLFHSPTYRKSIGVLAQGITRFNISKGAFLKIKVPLPKNPIEQQKIAACLSSLDDVITAESKKLEVLKEHKKGLLQNLFPQEGETVPKLRFKEFENSGEWVFDAFSEYIKLYRGSSPRPIQNYFTTDESGANWIKIGDTKNADNFLIKQVEERITPEGAKKSRKVEVGELILANSMSFGKTYQLAIEGYIYDGWFVLREYEKQFDKEFLLQLLNSDYMQNQYKKLSTGGIVQNISSDIVYNTVLPHTSVYEQKRIAACLSSLDEIISAQSQKIETLKLHKKGLLQGLFPDVNEHNG